MSSSSRPIKSLQIGMHWFPERAGGLDRMYYSLVGALPGAGVEVRGLVAGSPKVADDTGGAIQGFGPRRSRSRAGCSPRGARCATKSAARGPT